MTRYELQSIQDFLIEQIITLEFPGTETRLRYIDTSVIDKLPKLSFDNKYGLTKVSEDYTMDDIISVLSDGLADANAFCGVDYDDNEYYRAKDKLFDEGFERGSITLEAVQTKMLMMGYSLKIQESETHKWHELTLEKLLKGLDMSIEKVMKDYECSKLHAICIFFDEGDFYWFEEVLQNAIFGEVIYG